MNNKLKTILNIFEGKEIRSVWNSEKEDYYFSVIDVIGALTESKRARKYWNDIKNNLKKEGSELSEKIGQLKLKAKDGKSRITDTLNTEGIFRLIESIPSPKAEPFKLWLVKLGREKVDIRKILFNNIDKVHTTKLGVDRIKRNLKLNDIDVVFYLKDKILNKNSYIYKEGKNYYCEIDNIKITINSYNYSIITAHIIK